MSVGRLEPELTKFEIARRIGAGATGVVYEALDRETGSRVALKHLHRTDAATLLRFKKEFRGLQGLAHPNLVGLGELHQDGDEWFFTMELVRGVDFVSYVRPGRPANDGDGSAATQPALDPAAGTAAALFDEDRLRSALGQLAGGLQALHAAGKVHRDVKPSNVLVDRSGHVVILDFGLIADTDDDASTTLSVVGTAAYMAPEQSAATRVGPAADWYCVGGILYEILTGRPPFLGGTNIEILLKKQQESPARPSALVAGIPADLDSLCIDLLRREPGRRPTGADIQDRLGTAAPAGRAPARPIAPTEHADGQPFVGRERELAALETAFADSTEADAVAVFLHGESGVGKSELARRFTASLAARDGGVVVLSGKCFEREWVSYNALDGVIDSLASFLRKRPLAEVGVMMPRGAYLLGTMFPALLSVEVIACSPVPRVAVQDPQERRQRLFLALRELFQRLADHHRVVLLIDDFQWSDPDSIALLAHLLKPPEAPRVLLLATVRTTVDSDLDTLLGEEGRLSIAGARFEKVERLPRDTARELASLLMAEQGLVDTEVTESILDEVGGHPLFLHELVRHVGETGATTSSALGLDDALRARAERLPESARELLEVIAVAGAPIAVPVARAAARLDPDELRRALAELRVASFARGGRQRDTEQIEPYHDRVCEAVLSAMAEEVLRSRHHRLAIALEQAGAAASDPRVLVRHFEKGGEPVRAARYAGRAAEGAREALAFDQAAALYRDAIRLGDHPTEELRALRIHLGDALTDAGRGPEAAEAYLAAVDGADPATRLDCQRKAAEQFLVSGHIERGLDALSAVLSEIGVALPATPKRALMSVLWNRLKLRLRGLRWKERHESQVARETITRLDVYHAVSSGLGVVDSIRGMDFQVRGLLLALATGEPEHVGRALAFEAGYMATRGSRSERRTQKVLARAREVAEATDSAYLHGLVALATGFGHYFGGRFPDSVEAYTECERVLREETNTTSSWEVNTSRLFRLFALRRMGRNAERRRSYDAWLLDATLRGNRYLETTMRRSCNSLWLVEDDPDRARSELARATWSPVATGFHLQHWYELEAQGELALYEGAGAAAYEESTAAYRDMAGSLLGRIQVIGVSARWLRARLALAAAQERRESDAGLLAEVAKAARALAGERIGYATVYDLQLRAALAAHRGETARAVELLDNVVEAAEANSMLLHAEVARRRRGQLTGGSAGEEAIAAAEAWMRDEGVRRPDRISDVLAPGYARALD